MADNIPLNPGQGGAVLKTLQHADGEHTPTTALVYAATVSPGANVVQVVGPNHGLPVRLTDPVELAANSAVAVSGTVNASQTGDWIVKQPAAADLRTTAHQGGSWEVALAAGAEVKLASGSTAAVSGEVAATQAGAWMVSLAPDSEVKIAEGFELTLPDELSFELVPGAEVNLSPGAKVIAEQADPAELRTTAHQGGAWTVDIAADQVVGIAGVVPVSLGAAVTVEQSTAANLKVEATLAPDAEVKLAAGSSVAVSGTVALAPGTTVDLGSGATIDLDPNAEIKLGANNKLIGRASAGVDGSTVYDGTSPLKPKFARISASSQSDNVVVPRVPGKRIRVLRWGLTAHGDVSATWKSDDDAISGARPLTKYASAGGAYCPVGCFETETGDALVLALSAPVQVGGELTYVEVSD